MKCMKYIWGLQRQCTSPFEIPKGSINNIRQNYFFNDLSSFSKKYEIVTLMATIIAREMICMISVLISDATISAAIIKSSPSKMYPAICHLILWISFARFLWCLLTTQLSNFQTPAIKPRKITSIQMVLIAKSI